MAASKRHTVIKWFSLGLIGVAGLLFLGGLTWSKTYSQQPIAFNHKKHVNNNVACKVCHPLYETHARAGIPGVNLCIRCHEDVIYRTDEKDKIQQYHQKDSEIPWLRVYRIETSVYIIDRVFNGIPSKIIQQIYDGTNRFNFSHRRHTVLGKVDCAQCHGDLSNKVEPVNRPFVTIDMEHCTDCHNDQETKVSVDCVECHR